MSIKTEQDSDSRIPRTFKISEADLEGMIPESIESEQIENELSNTDPINWNNHPQPLFSKAMKLTAIGLGGVFCLTLINDLISIINNASALHWAFGIAVSTVLALLTLISGIGLFKWVRGSNDIEKIAEFQARAQELQTRRNSPGITPFIDHLVNFYRDTPQATQLENALSLMPDYLDDAERLKQLETLFIEPLDKRVENIIRKHSVQTGLAVAASPMPSLDALLTLWRTTIMIKEISDTYGIRPNFSNRMRVLYKVGRNTAYSGLSQTGLDMLDLSNFPALNIGAKAMQGAGACIATSRIGIQCAALCRPIPADESKTGYREKLVSSLLLLLGKKLNKGLNKGG
ncbi:YcjF family protein [uncultured Amphritea sp.]|uniref:YcjF family protein n=1 Tax=uncultured Amphritea sp. TaxID=981605 RepID=UPI0026022FC4|nr:YcjF family protein [uncultured Amphritea sp.]